MTAAASIAIAVLVVAAARRPPPPRVAALRPHRPCRRRSRLRRRSRTSCPDVRWDRVLDAIAAAVRSGVALRLAVNEAARRHCPGHALADGSVDLHHPAATRVRDADEAVVLHTLAAAGAFGGSTAATVQSGANLLRERAALRAEAQVHSAQARLSARVLTAVPVGFALWSAAASGTFRRAVTAPVGLLAASVGLLLNALGWWWMRHLVRDATGGVA